MAVMSPPVIQFEQPVDYRHEITARPDRVRFLVIPERRYLMIDGAGAPGGQEFQDAMSALYPVAYTLHFAIKRRGIMAPVGALEGLYWIGQPGPFTAAQLVASAKGNDTWSWRLLLPMPDDATLDDFLAATEEVARKKSPPAIDRLRCESWLEGRVAQIMHIGPYHAEPPTIERLHREIEQHGLRPHACHHEIYISDPNRTSPDRLKTLIRQPVEQR